MLRVSTYLNFMGTTEEAFDFYGSVFGTTYSAPTTRTVDMPGDPSAPPLSDAEKNMVMHCELPIHAGHVLMGTDMLESQGHKPVLGNNVTSTSRWTTGLGRSACSPPFRRAVRTYSDCRTCRGGLTGVRAPTDSASAG